MALIITDIDKRTVTAQHDRLYSLMLIANEVSTESNLTGIIEAQNACGRARELYNALHALGLTEGLRVTHEDIDRAEQKIADILDEKHRIRQWKN